MATSVTLTTADAATTSVTLTANNASTEYTLLTGSRGPAGAVGATGPAGADGTAVTVDATVIDGSTNAVSGNAVFDALALKAPLDSPVFTGSVTTSGDASIYTSGTNASISTSGYVASISTTGYGASIYTTGPYASISTTGFEAAITTAGQEAYISTGGTNAYISTIGTNAHIQSRSTFKLFNGFYTTTLSHTPTANRAIAFPNAAGTVALIDPSTGTQTFSGAQIFSSTTRPTSSGTGTPAANSLITRNDGDGRYSPSLKYLHGNRAITDTLKTTLDAGLDAAIGIITDSTGNAVDEWVYLTVADIAARHPNHRVLYRLWNDSTKKYDLTTIQNGVGGDRHINYPTGATFGYYQPITNLLDNWNGSDIEVQAEVSITAGGLPTVSCVLLSWADVSNTGRGWFQLGSTGFLQLNWSEDGSGAATKSVTSSVAMASLTAGAKYAFKATLDIDNGAGSNVVKFWYSTNSGTTWTQVGTTQTTAGATTVFTPSSTGSVTQNSRGSAPTAGLKFYRVQIYKGIDGQPLLPERIDLWQRNTSGGGNTASLSGAPVLYVDNIAISGFGLNAHLTLQTAPQAAYIERGRLFWALASSHNDQGMSFGEWGRKADELMAIVRTKSVDDAPVILITQNSQSTSALFSESHNKRCVQQLRVGSARGWPVIDANGAWRDYGDYSALMNADGIHPLAGGSTLTKNAILGAFGY